jgi:hypothetical protein
MHAGNYQIGKKMAHMKCFAADPDCEAHSSHFQAMPSTMPKPRLDEKYGEGVELIITVTYYSDPNCNHMIRIADRDLQATGLLAWTEADAEEREQLCTDVCTLLSSDGNEGEKREKDEKYGEYGGGDVTSSLRGIQQRYHTTHCTRTHSIIHALYRIHCTHTL